ncbi:MAG: hypothetical protein WDO15_06110 [Bacteroidota bacterium]
MLEVKFKSELESAKETLTAWEKARTINASVEEIPSNNSELSEKISRLEKGQRELQKFIESLALKLKITHAGFREIEDGIGSDRVRYTMIFTEAANLYNHKYTAGQKNDINKRITAVNSSRILNNTDMLALQKQWAVLLGMKNDKRLDPLKTIFEGRLSDWENLIEQKRKLTF